MDKALSIITVCYNDLENLKQTIWSLDEQSVQQFEHIIIDGHSDDGTLKFLQQLELLQFLFIDSIPHHITKPAPAIIETVIKKVIKVSITLSIIL